MTTVVLKKPIQFGDQVFFEITLKRPILGAMTNLDDAKGPVSQAHIMICICADQPKPVIDLIDPDDIGALVDAVSGFFPTDLETGES